MPTDYYSQDPQSQQQSQQTQQMPQYSQQYQQAQYEQQYQQAQYDQTQQIPQYQQAQYDQAQYQQTQQMPQYDQVQYQYQQPQYQQQYEQSQYQPQYQQAQYQQPQYSGAPQQVVMPSDDVTTTGEWVLNLFLVAIPIVGLVLLFVWAFGSNTASSKRNWARANLIWLLIGIALAVTFTVLMMAFGVSYQDYLRYHS